MMFGVRSSLAAGMLLSRRANVVEPPRECGFRSHRTLDFVFVW